MKKTVSVIVSAVLGAAILTSVFAGCTKGGKDSSSKVNIDIPSNLADNIKTTKPKYPSLEEYISQVKEEVENGAGFDDEYCTSKIYSDADGMVYEYTLREQNAGMGDEEIASLIKEIFDDNDSQFKNAAKELKNDTGIPYSLRVVYLNADGSVIEERKYYDNSDISSYLADNIKIVESE